MQPELILILVMVLVLLFPQTFIGLMVTLGRAVTFKPIRKLDNKMSRKLW